MNQLFYLPSNEGTLIICIKNKFATKIQQKSQATFIYHNDELIGVNIFGINNVIANLRPGLVYLNQQIQQYIQNQINLDLVFEKHFVVVKVVQCDAIPNTHLHKCVIFDGANNVDVICGAKNVQTNMLTVWAKPNTFLPNGQIIQSGTIMGHLSHGMLCSDKELGLAVESSGILNITNLEPGTEYLPVYNANK